MPADEERAILKAKVLALLAKADAARAANQSDLAAQLYGETLSVHPENTYALFQLAELRWQQKQLDEARDFCTKGLALEPDQVGLLGLFAAIASDLTDHATALRYLLRVSELAPDYPDLDRRLADQYHFLGRGLESIAAFDRALALNPRSTALQSDRLFVLNRLKLLDRTELFEEHRRWGARLEADLRRDRKPHSNDLRPDRPIRVGYVSADLRAHAVAYFLEGVLQHHDQNEFEIFVFDVSPFPEDHITARLKPGVKAWRRVGNLDDDALAAVISATRIDVLVDLAGHTAWNRLPVFARKPAPVQVSWFGYMNTTGLTTIDYRITDIYMDPPGDSERYYTETLFRIPHMACFTPATESPPINPLPALSTGIVTFASVNQWTKVTDEVKDVWAKIICSHPWFRLLIVARGAQFQDRRNEIVAQFVHRGVAADQVVVIPTMSLGDFLKLYHQIDVALDPFPYGGGTTSLHTIWMGVPIVTQEGESELARCSSGILRAVGGDDLVAQSAGAYRDIAVRLGEDLQRTATLRSELRSRMQRSTLVDAAALTKTLEQAYRTMWRNYCNDQATATS